MNDLLYSCLFRWSCLATGLHATKSLTTWAELSSHQTRLYIIRRNCPHKAKPFSPGKVCLRLNPGMKRSNWLGMCAVICLYLAGVARVKAHIPGIDIGRSVTESWVSRKVITCLEITSPLFLHDCSQRTRRHGCCDLNGARRQVVHALLSQSC
jgi:hypothetical protein